MDNFFNWDSISGLLYYGRLVPISARPNLSWFYISSLKKIIKDKIKNIMYIRIRLNEIFPVKKRLKEIFHIKARLT